MKSGRKHKKRAPWRHWELERLPILDLLNERFIGLEPQMQKVAGIYSTYVLGLELGDAPIAPRVLVTGPVSSGKTSVAQFLACQLNVPTVTLNLGSLSPSGYKGTDLSDGLQSLIKSAGGADKLEKFGGVVILDEFEKLQARARHDDFLASTQYNIFGLLGGEKVPVPSNDFDSPVESLDTKNLLVILCGAFSDVPERSWRSLDTTVKTLLRLGYQPELVSRFSHHIHLGKPKRKEVNAIVAREVESLRAVYRAGPEPLALSPYTIRKITEQVVRGQLGIRSARLHIHEALFQKAVEHGLGKLL